MIKDSVTVEEAIATLNRLYRTDREAMVQLLVKGEKCNRDMAYDEDLNVHVVSEENVESLGAEYLIGMMSIINALFGKEFGLGPISHRWGAHCPGNGCELPEGSKFGEPCPVCGHENLEPGNVKEDAPFGDLRPFIKQHKEDLKNKVEA